RRADAEPASVRINVQEPSSSATLLEHDDAQVCTSARNLEWILSPVLNICRACQHARTGRIQNEQVIVICTCAQRIRPVQVDLGTAADLNHIEILSAEIVHIASQRKRRR